MRVSTKALTLAPALLLGFCWQLWVKAYPQSEFFLGSPAGIARETRVLLGTGNLGTDFVVTTSEALVGFVAGSLLGTALGLSLWYSRVVYEIARPYIIALG